MPAAAHFAASRTVPCRDLSLGEWIACKLSVAPPGVGKKFCWVGRITIRTEAWRDTRLKLREISADLWASDGAQITPAPHG
jgi:hypothetical protein